MRSDYCPYCDHEINVEIYCDKYKNGNINDCSVTCPSCKKNIRIKVEFEPMLTIEMEEKYFEREKRWLETQIKFYEEKGEKWKSYLAGLKEEYEKIIKDSAEKIDENKKRG